MTSTLRRTKDQSTGSRLRRQSTGNCVSFDGVKQHQYVWVSTDMVETALKSGGTLPKTWKHRPRDRSNSTEWGWCRAIVLSSTVVHADAALKEGNANNALTSPFGQFTLRKCAISPPGNNSNASNPAVSALPWDATPKPKNTPSKTVSMTVTVDDMEFAPEHLHDVTVCFTYTTAENDGTLHGDTDLQRVCLANDWWNQNRHADSSPPTDLTALEQLHEPAVVYCLLRRYRENHIYTYTGKILLALNPFQNLDHLYGESVMQQYWTQRRGQPRLSASSSNSSTTERSNDAIDRPPPHVYAVAEDAYRSALRSLQDASPTSRGEDQSILVSGESGAGKTVTTKIILQYLTLLSQQSDKSTTTVSGIESQVLESNPILESFGNARTVRNDNSSRFGKFLDMQFESTGCLVSASIETYLLEKVRLISQSPGERNYHVFYELLSGLSTQERRQLHMTGRSVNDFCMTCASGTFDRRDGVSDFETFKELRNAFDTVGFSRNEQSDLFTVTCALLYTSNLTFVEESADASMLDTSNPSLKCAVDLLGVDVSGLNNAVCKCAIEARGEVLFKHLSIDQAEKAVEALIKTTYGALFSYIVRKINGFITIRQTQAKIHTNGRTVHPSASIGVLDIFGFESFERNSFEQLCINYCNEALQQQFNRFVFKIEQQEYQKEGIDWSFIAFPDNQDVLDLIEKRHDGILSVLDEQSRLPRCTDATFAHAVYQKCGDHARFEVTKAMQAQLSFAIHHYAGFVEYDTVCFLEKNRDELSKETTDLLKSSSNKFLAMLGRELSEGSDQSLPTSRSPKKGSKVVQRSSSSLLRDSVGAQFCSQLKLLRTRIESTAPHYVRCLKPNDELLPHCFDALVIADQLRCAGVLEAVRVSRLGFPNRYYHDHFSLRYGTLEPAAVAHFRRKKISGRELCSFLVELFSPKLTEILDPTVQPGDKQGR
jgi:myosin V